MGYQSFLVEAMVWYWIWNGHLSYPMVKPFTDIFAYIRISNHMPSKAWGEITYPFPNINGSNVEVEKLRSKFVPNLIFCVATYLCWDLCVNGLTCLTSIDISGASWDIIAGGLNRTKMNEKTEHELIQSHNSHTKNACIAKSKLFLCLFSRIHSPSTDYANWKKSILWKKA